MNYDAVRSVAVSPDPSLAYLPVRTGKLLNLTGTHNWKLKMSRIYKIKCLLAVQIVLRLFEGMEPISILRL